MAAVNVLYAFDTRFWKLAAVSMHSLLANRKNETKYVIHCMVAPRTRGKKQIARMVRRMGGELVWRVVRSRENPYQSYDYSRWSPVIFYRLIAHRIFPELDKILYLDSDTIILDDLSDLYKTNISKYVMGAVRDMAPINNEKNPNGVYVRDFANKYLNNGPYFNSGVLLLNVDKMQQHQDLALRTDVPLKYPDQDILNVAFRGQIKKLPLRYNFASGVSVDPMFSDKESKDAFYNTAILHFYAAKPYVYRLVPRNAYSAFYKNATALGFYPEDFIAQEIKHRRKKKQETTQTSIPYLRFRHGRLWLFGILRI